MTRRCAPLALTLLLALGGCSSVDHDDLAEKTELAALEPFAGQGGGHRILVAGVYDAAGASEASPDEDDEDDKETLRGPMELEARALERELVDALGRIFPDVDGRRGVAVADDPEQAAAQAWREGYDLLLRVHVERWDAAFLENNGWWIPNAFLIGIYFWPIGPQWWIADEVYGVDCALRVELVSAASERSLPLLERERRVLLKSSSGDADPDTGLLLQPPAHDLNDLQRGLDWFGTWSSSRDADQWGQIGSNLEPYARRHAAVEVTGVVGKAVGRFDAMTGDEREAVLSATHAVVVGVSSYKTPCLAADADADLVARLLAGELADVPPDGSLDDATDGAFVGRSVEERRWAPAKNVHHLVNGRASREGIVSALEQVRERARPEDRLVVSFAGRGARLTKGEGLGRFAFVPFGDRPLSLSRLAELVTAVPARRRLVIFDVDFGPGERGWGKQRVSMPAGFEEALRAAFLEGASSGAVVLATSLGRGEGVQAYEGQGLLTQTLVRALRGAADEGGDGLSYADLSAYLERHVVHLSEVALARPQRPLVVALSEQDEVR
jgi:hypothetical protein